MYWERMTAPELNALDRNVPLVLSVAAVEQHGPHLASGTDSIIGAHFLQALEAARPDGVVVLPQVKVGCSEHHMDLGGTLTVSHAVFIDYVCELAGSALRHGFRNLVILNSHGGNIAAAGVIGERLGLAFPACRIVVATWWRLAAEGLLPINLGGPGSVGHACEFETSVVMCAAPGEVRGDRIPERGDAATFPWAEGDLLRGSPAVLVRTMAEMTGGTGVLGTPALASPDHGERITGVVVDALTSVVDTLFAAQPKEHVE
ncbi:creatininase family protein [Acuticoccus yangtzensis]|uniref:creatininase family protein n=1 Tax=Acuticoccus yangtzensis TaxID=1443441 RepID=UPI000949A1E0|nr:creatininase family protein [Acuticoccus yangtzensis]